MTWKSVSFNFASNLLILCPAGFTGFDRFSAGAGAGRGWRRLGAVAAVVSLCLLLLCEETGEETPAPRQVGWFSGYFVCSASLCEGTLQAMRFGRIVPMPWNKEH